MDIKGKQIKFNITEQNTETSVMKQETVSNGSIFSAGNVDNRTKLKENSGKEEYLNGRIQQVKEFTVEKLKNEFDNKSLEYDYPIDKSEFNKAVEMYMDLRLNTMIETVRKQAAENGKDENEAAIVALGTFVNKINSLDENGRKMFFGKIADQAVERYKNNPKGESFSDTTISLANTVEISRTEEELPLVDLLLLLGDLKDNQQEQIETFTSWIEFFDTGDTTVLREIKKKLYGVEFRDLNFLRKAYEEIPTNINVEELFDDNKLKEKYPEDKYTIIKSNDVQEGIYENQIISVYSNESNEIIYKYQIVSTDGQIYKIDVRNNDISGDMLYKATYNRKGTLIDKHTTGTTDYIMKLEEILNEKKRFFGKKTSDDELIDLIRQIDTDYVVEVLTDYDDSNYAAMFYDEDLKNSLIKDIFAMRRTPNSLKFELAKHIIDKLVRCAELEDVNIDDIKTELYKELDKQASNLRMSSEKIDRYVRCIYLRIEDRHLDDKYENYGGIQNVEDEASPNGKIDNAFQQGYIGDCWLISELKAAANNEETRKILEDCIEVQSNGDVKVTLKGADVSYIIPKNRLIMSDYAQGDMDVRAIEIAVEKYMKNEEGNVHGIHGNKGDTASKLLFGVKPKLLECKHKTFWQRLLGQKYYLNKIKSGKYLITSGIYNEPSKTAINENGENVELDYPHGYTVTNADDEWVYFSNPHDKTGVLKMSHDDFFSTFDEVCFTKVSKIRKKIQKYIKLGK